MIFEIDGIEWEFSCNFFDGAEFVNPTKPYKLSFPFKDQFRKKKVENVEGLEKYKLVYHPNQEIYDKFEQIGENPEIEEEWVETMSYFSLADSWLQVYRSTSGSFVFCYEARNKHYEIEFDQVHTLRDLEGWIFEKIVEKNS